MSNFFHSTNPSEYPDSWDDVQWPLDANGEGDEYCPECGCDFPVDPASHAMECEIGQDLRDEAEAEFAEQFPDDVPYYDTMAEQTGLDR